MAKPIDWRGSSLEDLRAFPAAARKDAGYQLRKLQRGELPDDWRSFPAVGPGTGEIRIDCRDGWFRVQGVHGGTEGRKMTIDTKSRHTTPPHGNVFLDLGFSPTEAKRLLAQADARIDESVRLKKQLMDEIAAWMKKEKLTQAAAAEALRVSRPRVSDVVNHKVDKFTIDSLVAMLFSIGKQVRMAVK